MLLGPPQAMCGRVLFKCQESVSTKLSLPAGGYCPTVDKIVWKTPLHFPETFGTKDHEYVPDPKFLQIFFFRGIVRCCLNPPGPGLPLGRGEPMVCTEGQFVNRHHPTSFSFEHDADRSTSGLGQCLLNRYQSFHREGRSPAQSAPVLLEIVYLV